MMWLLGKEKGSRTTRRSGAKTTGKIILPQTETVKAENSVWDMSSLRSLLENLPFQLAVGDGAAGYRSLASNLGAIGIRDGT